MASEIEDYVASCASERRALPSHRRESFQSDVSVDVHCHCLPGLDDGPRTMTDALQLCHALVSDGMTHVVGVAHQLGRYEGRNDSACVRHAVSEVNAMLESEQTPLRILPGGDVRIDERIPDLLDRDQILTAGDGGRYLLLELPSDVCIDPMRLVEMLKKKRVETILTHPERYRYLTSMPEKVLDWVQGGIYLQVTAGSLMGDFGASAMKAAWDWLQRGVVAMIASDAHHVTRRPPHISDARAAISSRLGSSVASIVCLENPRRVIEGRPILSANEEVPEK